MMIRKDFAALICIGVLLSTASIAGPARKRAAAAPSHQVSRSACRAAIDYQGLGSPPDAQRAQPFGAGLLSLSDRSQRVVALSPDGRQLFFTPLAPPGPQILESDYRDGRWQAPKPAPFSNIGINTEPSFSPDGRTLFFISTRPPSKGTDIWKVEHAGAGWGEPERLGDAVNGPGLEWHPQVAANGDLYFASDDRPDGQGDADLYVSRYRDGAYLPAQDLGPPVDTAAREWDGYVDPGETYLIFKSNRPGGYGGLDLYISERRGGAWSEPRNLGPAINTPDDEDAAEVTPDGRYLTFARSTPGAQHWQMYWLGAGALFPGGTGPRTVPCASAAPSRSR